MKGCKGCEGWADGEVPEVCDFFEPSPYGDTNEKGEPVCNNCEHDKECHALPPSMVGPDDLTVADEENE